MRNRLRAKVEIAGSPTPSNPDANQEGDAPQHGRSLMEAASNAKADRLTRDEEHALAFRARAGDESAFDELVMRSLPLVRSIAWRWRGHGIPIEDLVQQGTLGLICAVEKFEPEFGFRLSTYATWWIRKRVAEHIKAHDRQTRPTPDDRVLSLDEPVGDDGAIRGDFIPHDVDPYREFEDAETRIVVAQLLAAADADHVDYTIVDAIVAGDFTAQTEIETAVGLTRGELRGRMARLCAVLEELRAA